MPSRDTRRAKRLFWTVLSVATLASVSGNVAHALLNAAPGAATVSAAAAAVPPVILLAAIHGLGTLARARQGSGAAYWAAMVMTVLLACGAFALSFDALRALAVTAGIRSGLAWIWPLIIDLSIAQSTLAILALTRLKPGASGHVAGDGQPHVSVDLPSAMAPAEHGGVADSNTPSEAEPQRPDSNDAAAGEGIPAVEAVDDDAVTIIECDRCATAEVADEAHPRRNAEARWRRGWRSDGHGARRRDFCPSCPQVQPGEATVSRDETRLVALEPVASPA
ncbi:DUF2637 domain-containing protein [Mycobacterium hackensackense]|nr:DUF2637 domain-containing protein [Mycobacterium hackensackense]